MGKGKKKLVGTDNRETSDLSKKQSGMETKNKEEELAVMDENTKKVLVIETKLNDYEKRRSIEGLFGKDVEIISVKPVLMAEDYQDLVEKYPDQVELQTKIVKKSLKALMTLFDKYPGLVMFEARIVRESALIIAITEKMIPKGVQVREALYCESLADDKVTKEESFRGYGPPITDIKFV